MTCTSIPPGWLTVRIVLQANRVLIPVLCALRRASALVVLVIIGGSHGVGGAKAALSILPIQVMAKRTAQPTMKGSDVTIYTGMVSVPSYTSAISGIARRWTSPSVTGSLIKRRRIILRVIGGIGRDTRGFGRSCVFWMMFMPFRHVMQTTHFRLLFSSDVV